jgi:hypothetical protein
MADLYCVPTWDPKQVARVGWGAEFGSYWFIVYYRGPFGEVDVTDTEVTYTMGVDEPWRKITDVGQLLMFTWGEVNWETPEGLYAFRALRDDPIYESLYGPEALPQSGIDDFVEHALDPQAMIEAMDASRGHSLPVVPPPTPMAGAPAIAPKRPLDRVPVHRRRFTPRPNPND